MKNNCISRSVTVFHERITPEKGLLVGYGALIDSFALRVPIPDRLSLISKKTRHYDTEEWAVFTPRHSPKDDLFSHLTFALKYEGLELNVLKSLFLTIDENEITKIITSEPTGQYSRRIWFLYEWLLNKKLDIPDLKTGNFIDLINPKLQYPGPSEKSKRHRVNNNLPGVRSFCPLIRRTKKLEQFIELHLSKKLEAALSKIQKNILLRASAFLLLKDSKASYAIEGETPPQNRAQRWGRAIGQAGEKLISKEEFLRLQQIIIESDRFVKMGFRKEEGFVGEHDRTTGTPIPDHISAKREDLDTLMQGLIDTNNKLQDSDYDAVLAAAIIAFGFIFIHPFVDGNGRIHRYLIHHVLSKMGFANKGMIFPVSSVILERIDEYRKVLETYSIPRMDLINWKKTADNNVEVLNNTTDLYRYFDATRQAEFLYSCVRETVDVTIPEEVKYLKNFDRMKVFVEEQFDMPDKTFALLVRFLEQGHGKLSKRARSNEFRNLSQDEIVSIENAYADIFDK